MNIEQMLNIIQNSTGITLDQHQKQVVDHEQGPLWIMAGPGSGKTMVLALRCLKLLCVDRIPPKSIIITTFTEKAAKNIHDRLATYKSYLEKEDSSLIGIDLSLLYLGTLHSLCNDIMQEYTYSDYQNYRLLDDIDQLLFIYDHSSLASTRQNADTYLHFWQQFHYLVERFNNITKRRWGLKSKYVPHRWTRAHAARILYNRICEDRIDLDLMRQEGGAWEILVESYNDYTQSLESHGRCDFAHLQSKFLDFLSSPLGKQFIEGEGTIEHPGIFHVLVDEYQDTNQIQEEIYLQLARNSPHNLGVVGDDDQALYRFRGGTVECMVNFDSACKRHYGNNISIQQIPLSINYRSNPEIVTWIDEYIRSHDVMTQEGARVPNKPKLDSDINWLPNNEREGRIIGPYPAVSFLVGHSGASKLRDRKREEEENAAERFALLARGLIDNDIVTDPRDMVLLLSSTRSNYTAPYRRALEQVNIPVYNPRARNFLFEEEIQTALGALISIIDPEQNILENIHGNGLQETMSECLSTYNQIVVNYPGLQNYIEKSIVRINETPAGGIVTQISEDEKKSDPNLWATLQEIFYHIISLEPFKSWKEEALRTIRLGLLSNVLESYSSTPFLNSFGSTRGCLRKDRNQEGIDERQLCHFYHSLIGLLVSEGLSDPEDPEIIRPSGYLPIMTIHQAKGLEFPFVFTTNLGIRNVDPRPEHQLETALQPFRTINITLNFDNVIRSEQDSIRLFYAAYSRAQYALILVMREFDLMEGGIGFGGFGRSWFQRKVFRLRLETEQEVD